MRMYSYKYEEIVPALDNTVKRLFGEDCDFYKEYRPPHYEALECTIYLPNVDGPKRRIDFVLFLDMSFQQMWYVIEHAKRYSLLIG